MCLEVLMYLPSALPRVFIGVDVVESGCQIEVGRRGHIISQKTKTVSCPPRPSADLSNVIGTRDRTVGFRCCLL